MRVVLALALLSSCASAQASERAPTGRFYLVGEINKAWVPFVEEFLANTVAPEIVLSTQGGDMMASTQIAELVAIHGAVRCTVRDRANSGGFAILQACKVRTMKASASLATHEPRMFMSLPIERGIAELMFRSLSEISETWNARCRARLKLSAKEYESRVRGRDWTMGAYEALIVGAVDGIVP